ncbi:BCAM0308 family protein [Nitrospira sp. Kam-Ns4a]
MMNQPGRPANRLARRDRAVQEWRHDTYSTKRKPPLPTACPQCGALFQKGRWSWSARPPQVHEALCPACRRINDHYPAGEVTLGGDFFAAHRAEILALVRNEEAREKAEHPLARIMRIEETEGGAVITTTDVHLARRLGEALRRSYQGTLELRYNEDQQFVRVTWSR